MYPNRVRPTARPTAQQPSSLLSIQSGVNGNPNFNTSIDPSGFGEAAQSAWENAQGMFGRPSGGGGGFGGGVSFSGGGPIGVTTQEVKDNQLMSHQLDQMLDSDGAYMQRARQAGLDLAHQRGLGNSSIAAGNAMASAIDRAAPIAGFDASRYGSVADQNMGAQNAAAMQAASQAHSASMAAASAANARAMQNAAHQNAMQGMMFGHGLGGVDDFRRHVLSMENREDDQAFRAGQADIDRFINQDQFYRNYGLSRDQFGLQRDQFSHGVNIDWANDAFRNRELDSRNWQVVQSGFMNAINSIYMNPHQSAEHQAAAVNQVRQQFPGFMNEAWQMLPPGVMSDQSVRAAQAMPPMRRFRGGP